MAYLELEEEGIDIEEFCAKQKGRRVPLLIQHLRHKHSTFANGRVCSCDGVVVVERGRGVDGRLLEG